MNRQNSSSVSPSARAGGAITFSQKQLANTAEGGVNYAVGKNASMVCKKKNKNSPFIREGRKSEDELKRAQERLPSLSDSSVDEVLYRALSMSSVSLFTCPDSGITAVTARHSAASATRAQKQKTNKRERREGKETHSS